MKNNGSGKKFFEIWGDAVSLKELAIATVISTVITFGLFLLGRDVILAGFKGKLEPSLLKGYSLLSGILGVIVSSVVCALLFKPKREILEEKEEQAGELVVEEALKELEISPEDEKELLNTLDETTKNELKETGLYDLFLSAKKQA